EYTFIVIEYFSIILHRYWHCAINIDGDSRFRMQSTTIVHPIGKAIHPKHIIIDCLIMNFSVFDTNSAQARAFQDLYSVDVQSTGAKRIIDQYIKNTFLTLIYLVMVRYTLWRTREWRFGRQIILKS